ncbi:hypothetical protein LJR296_001475 [Cupriavidus necator]|uniref:surface-adhesin E family protein n=1 Tax=Cupriavidus necator TaxID=106590 RepID=UPI003ECF3964
MLRLFATLAIAIAGAALPAMAETKWKPISQTATHLIYVAESQPDEILPANSVWLMFSILDINSATTIKSSKMLFEGDCKNGRVRTLQEAHYRGDMGAGDVVNVGDRGLGTWRFPVPNTAETLVAQIVCPKRQQSQRRPPA